MSFPGMLLTRNHLHAVRKLENNPEHSEVAKVFPFCTQVKVWLLYSGQSKSSDLTSFSFIERRKVHVSKMH